MVLRELFAKLGLDVDAQSFAKGQLAVEVVKFGLGRLVDVAQAAVKGFVDLAVETAEYAGELDDTSQAIGLQTDALQELRHAFALGGVGAEELTSALRLLSANLAAAAKGEGEASKVLASIGVRAKDAGGKIRPTDEVLGDLAEKFAAMPDGAGKTALALQLFGRAGAKMIPTLNAGRDGLADMRREAEELGLVLGGDVVKAGDELGDTLDTLSAMWRGIKHSVGGELIPYFLKAAKATKAWVRENRTLIRQGLGVVLKPILWVMRGIGKAVQAVGTFVGILADNWQVALILITAATAPLILQLAAVGIAAAGAAAGMVVAWLAAAAPVLALAAAFAGIMLVVNSFQRHKQGRDSLVGDWLKALDEWLKPKADDVWWVKAIKDFVRYVQAASEGWDQLRAKILGGIESSGYDHTPGGFILKRIIQATSDTPPATLPSSPGGGAWSPRIAATFNITQQPGQSGTDVAGALRAEWESWWDGKMEAAAAATP